MASRIKSPFKHQCQPNGHDTFQEGLDGFLLNSGAMLFEGFLDSPPIRSPVTSDGRLAVLPCTPHRCLALGEGQCLTLELVGIILIYTPILHLETITS